MSSPPISSPSTYSWGYVGQSEYSFSPSRTSSSWSMSNVPYLASSESSISTICREKPQRGADGTPFMKSMTRCRLSSSFSRSSIVGGGGEAAADGDDDDSTFFSTLGDRRLDSDDDDVGTAAEALPPPPRSLE